MKHRYGWLRGLLGQRSGVVDTEALLVNDVLVSKKTRSVRVRVTQLASRNPVPVIIIRAKPRFPEF